MDLNISYRGCKQGRSGLIVGMCLLILLQASAVRAQSIIPDTYQVQASAQVVRGNFVRARNLAVKRAMRHAVEESMIVILGETEYVVNQRALRGILDNAKKYVQTYRFINAYDDELESVAEVSLEVSLFADALRKKLNSIGILSGQMDTHSAVILINEKGLTGYDFVPFWDTEPLSEAFLTADFKTQGISLVERDTIRGAFDEAIIFRAARGDISAAVDIGMKVGADLVVVGNAVSTLVGDTQASGPKTVQVSLSLKAISALKSRVVAAKSDFATVRKPTAAEAEAEAYKQVSQKLSGFFVTSINRFWKPKSASPQPVPKSVSTNSMEDL